MSKTERIKRFIDCYIETETCNLRCHYCYIALQNRFNNKIVHFEHSPKIIRKALSKKRLGGICHINMCAGGETLLSEEMNPVIKELLDEGHIITIVTNGTLKKRFEEIATWPQALKDRLFIKFSFHYLELKRLQKLDTFLFNINLMKKNGVSYSVEITPSDELIPLIDEVKAWSLDNLGALPHLTIARDDRKEGIDILSDLSFDEYKKLWGQFDSNLFMFKSEIYQKLRKEYCYAGDWSIFLNLNTGDIKQCYRGKNLENLYQNIDKPLSFEAIGCNCSLAYCYNGHAFLTFGDIPSLNTPTYADMRNRVCVDGSEFLQPIVKDAFCQKLAENNKKASVAKRVASKISAFKRRKKETAS